VTESLRCSVQVSFALSIDGQIGEIIQILCDVCDRPANCKCSDYQEQDIDDLSYAKKVRPAHTTSTPATMARLAGDNSESIAFPISGPKFFFDRLSASAKRSVVDIAATFI
jgi:hypothetical protein